MNQAFKSGNELLAFANRENLYQELILQLNKDLKLSNVEDEFETDVKPEKLIRQLHEIIFLLINEKFADYLNLLYIIDVSEKEIKQLDGSDVVRLSEQVVFLILKREWKKIWFRNKYK